MKKISEAESLLNEALGEKPKRVLKKEANEDLTKFSLKKLTANQIDQALQNSGYSDNRITFARFKKTELVKGSPNFVYECQFDGTEMGMVWVYVAQFTGEISANFDGM